MPIYLAGYGILSVRGIGSQCVNVSVPIVRTGRTEASFPSFFSSFILVCYI